MNHKLIIDAYQYIINSTKYENNDKTYKIFFNIKKKKKKYLIRLIMYFINTISN